MDKMKTLLEEYKTKIACLESELAATNEKWDKRWDEEKRKEMIYVMDIENKLGNEISQLKKDRVKKQQQISDLSMEQEKLIAKTKIKK